MIQPTSSQPKPLYWLLVYLWLRANSLKFILSANTQECFGPLLKHSSLMKTLQHLQPKLTEQRVGPFAAQARPVCWAQPSSQPSPLLYTSASHISSPWEVKHPTSLGLYTCYFLFLEALSFLSSEQSSSPLLKPWLEVTFWARSCLQPLQSIINCCFTIPSVLFPCIIC